MNEVASAGDKWEVVGICVVDGLNSETDDFIKRMEAEEQPLKEAHDGASSAGGRCGWFLTPASCLSQPDFQRYGASVGPSSAHVFVALHSQHLSSALLMYPAGAQSRAYPMLPRGASKFDGEGQPRHRAIYAGRHFLKVSAPNNRALQLQGGPSASHNKRKVEAAITSLVILHQLGLASMEQQPDAFEGSLLGGQVQKTMQYTQHAFSVHSSVDSALSSLAACKGFYVNKFPAALHKDADSYLETWSIRQLQEMSTAVPAATILPQLGLMLSADANKTVWTANLSNIMHAAQELGGLATLGSVACWRGAYDAFHLQSRGASTIYQHV